MLNVMILKHLFLLNAVSRHTFLYMIKKKIQFSFINHIK